MNLILFICINALMAVGLVTTYVYLKKLKNLIGYHLGMNISMTISTVSALSLGPLWAFQFHHHSSWITMIVTLAAMTIGMLFGALVDYQTVVTGISSGIMAGLMGPMIIMHSFDPIPLLCFTLFLFFFSLIMLCTSVKV
ncbi:hypothetical protein ACH6EH_18870 [Paenibacillus sp. JSM ZJ436]|uniref:hypothetical protein n=1 Tax=Paenibacillus sp. JSM ZJ436 TaxID=3376190 RepID=UPI0037977D18